MRAVVILALAAFLCATASAVVTTQEEAKNLKNDWPACSQIVQGRLGSLTPAGTPTSNPYSIPATVTNGNHSGWVQYWPCVPHSVSGNSNGVPSGTGNLFVSIGSTQAVYTVSSTKFSMPAQKNDVAKFIATMTLNQGYGNAPTAAIVTTSCAETADNIASPNGTYTMTGGASKTLNVFLTDINACARFPYTNSNVPGGAVAAIIVVLACFVIQFSICGWYHWTHKQDTPLDHQME